MNEINFVAIDFETATGSAGPEFVRAGFGGEEREGSGKKSWL